MRAHVAALRIKYLLCASCAPDRYDSCNDVMPAGLRFLADRHRTDVEYFREICARVLDESQVQALHDGVLKAYRWQYIVSGVQEPRFSSMLSSMITPQQGASIGTALAPILQ